MYYWRFSPSSRHIMKANWMTFYTEQIYKNSDINNFIRILTIIIIPYISSLPSKGERALNSNHRLTDQFCFKSRIIWSRIEMSLESPQRSLQHCLKQPRHGSNLSMDRWKDKEDIVNIYHGNIPQPVKERNNANGNNMDGPRDWHTYWSKPEKKKYRMISLA